MKNFKMLQVYIDFSTNFLIFSQDSGVPPPNPYKCKFQNFLNFPINFSENFDKFLKNFQKLAKFSKNYNFFIDFLNFFKNFRF